MKRRKVVNCGRYPKYTYTNAKFTAWDAIGKLNEFVKMMRENEHIHGVLTDKEIDLIEEASGLLLDYVSISDIDEG